MKFHQAFSQSLSGSKFYHALMADVEIWHAGSSLVIQRGATRYTLLNARGLVLLPSGALIATGEDANFWTGDQGETIRWTFLGAHS